MHRLLGAIFGIAIVTASYAVEAPATSGGLLKTLISGIPHSALFGLSLDGGSGVAVGAGGSIFESADGGVTWKGVEKAPTLLALLAVAKRGPHTIAVGQSGVVVLREGNAWKTSDSGVPSRLLSVDVNTSGLAFAGGEFGTLLKSTDAGKSWTSSAPDWASMASTEHFGTGEPMIYTVVVEESGQITIAGEFGVMLRSNDAGATWRVLRPINPQSATIHAMTLAPKGQGNSYAVGQSGELLISADEGETWLKCDTGTDLNFLGIAASPSGQVVATGMRVMYRSENFGMTWTKVEEDDTKTDWYQAVKTDAGSGRILAVGHAGKIIQIGG